MILSQPVFVNTSWCSVLGGEATNTNYIILDLTNQAEAPTHNIGHWALTV